MLFSRSQHFLNPFTMLPVKGSFETGLIGHISSHVFRSAWFRKEISYEGHLFFENIPNLMHISKMQKKYRKKLFVFEIIASELVALNCLYSEENTCHQQSMCQQKLIRLCVLLKQTFSDSITFQMISKYGNSAVFQIATLFEPVYHVACQRFL